MSDRPPFPFSAVVGHDELRLALVLAAADPAIGGVLLRGQKGSAKTTLARGLAGLLPGHAPFVELPVGASEDRVVGTIDLRAALVGGERRFVPGLLAQAHGGVLYVDEVNLLPDHLVDVLLDVAASGVNRVEREGVSETHPSRFVLLGSMNPEEGDLRPQLLDRFGLSVAVVASTDPAERAEIVRRRLAYDADPAGFAAGFAAEEAALRRRVAEARPAPLAAGLAEAVARLCVAAGAEGLRADLVCCRAAAALAGWEGRAEAGEDDVRRVAPLALAHRARRHPLDPPGVPPDLSEAFDEAFGPSPGEAPPGSDAPRDGEEGGGRPAVAPAAPGVPPRLVVPARRAEQAAPGRRSPTTGLRGRLVGDRVPDGPPRGVAVGATVVAAAARGARTVAAEDLREPVRQARAGNLVVLAVDASGSMGADARMAAAKGAVVSLLLDAYQRRDQVALVTFGGDGARVALRPTGSVEVARARLEALDTGGTTPLADGIDEALALARPALDGPHRPLLVLVSDGRATAAGDGLDPLAAARAAAARVRRAGVPAVVVDAEDGTVRLGLAAELAAAMGARYLPVGELTADAVVAAVRDTSR